MSTNALEIMRMPELFLGSSTTFETRQLNGGGAYYGVVITIPETRIIDQVGFNFLNYVGFDTYTYRIRILNVLATGLPELSAAGLATTANFTPATTTFNNNGKMNYFNLTTPVSLNRGQIVAIVLEQNFGSVPQHYITVATRVANTFDAIGNRQRFPYGVMNNSPNKYEGTWFGYRMQATESLPAKYQGFNPNSVKSNAGDTAGRAYGNFFKCPALGATLTCSGMKVVINETEATDNTIYELWSFNYSTNSVSLLSSTTLSSGIKPQGVGYNKQIFFTTPVNLTAGEYYAITVRSSANSIDYKYLQFEDTGFIDTMQSFGSVGTGTDIQHGSLEINTSTNVATQLGRLYLMNPLISSINGATTIGSFTANFNSFNG